jgi:DNA-binding Lrp family transcriptional regulator
VDDLDLRILRWMYRGGVWSWWGTDPRITTTEIASHVGLTRTAVWARIRRWRKEGFWDGFGVRLNPRIFGVGQVHFEVGVPGPAQASALMDELEHLDGVVWARDVFGEAATGGPGAAVLVTTVTEDSSSVRRRTRVLRRLSPVGRVLGPYRDVAPQCSHMPSALDWRVIAAILANPNASPARLARLVGVTLKTFDLHHSTLIDSHAVFYAPRVDWSKMGCVCLGIFCRQAEDLDPVRAELEVRIPSSIPMSLEGFENLSPEWNPATVFGELVPAYSPNEVHALIRQVSRIPGVRRVLTETWGAERLYSAWFTRRTAEHIATAPAPVPTLVTGSRDRKRSGHLTAVTAGALGLSHT